MFPEIVVNDPVTPFVTVAFCHAMVPIAALNVMLVPVAVQIEELNALNVPTAVGWLTVNATAELVADGQVPKLA